MLKDMTLIDPSYVKGYMVKQKVIQKCNENTMGNIRRSKKLRTYSLIKDVVKYEPYLDNIKNVEHRKMLTRLRISAHDLNIERGRYKGLEVNERKCLYCNEIEDEKHFLFVCTGYKSERQPFIEEMYKINDNLKMLDTDNLFVFMLTNESIELNKIIGKMLSCLCEKRTKDQNH